MIFNYCIKNNLFSLLFFVFFQHYLSASTNPNIQLRGNVIGFTENKGQVADHEGNLRPDILFTGDGGGTLLFIRNTGISYVLSKSDEEPEETEPTFKVQENLKHYTHRIDVDFIGCNPTSPVVKMDEVEGYKNFYYPHCSSGLSNIKSYNSVLQKNIYNNIDILYKGNKSEGLKYDFIVNPGGKPGDIILKYSGHNNIKIEDGNLIVSTSLGELTEFMPKVYQEINGKIKDVKAKYELTKENNIVIAVDNYNKNLPLVIDPWVTYFGGSRVEDTKGIATDGAGNVVFVGKTQSTGFPILGAFQSSLAGGFDGFIGKLSSAGALIWSTYYGGSAQDDTYGVSADPATNEVYFCGSTSSVNFPVGAATGQTSFLSTFPTGAGGTNAILVKLTSAGTRLWATFYGDDSGVTYALDTDIDSGGDVLMTGRTNSTNNIATAGTFQASLAANNDIFVVKFSPIGNRIWGTYIGGSDNEGPGSISCDVSNNIYVSGTTNSSDLPVTTGAHQISYGGGSNDVFLFKLNSSGQREWGTYYGGSARENIYDTKVDNVGDMYIGGATISPNNISTPGTYQTIINPGATQDGFLAKFNSSGVRQWATYLGGGLSANGANDYISGIGIDVNNNVVVAGDTYCTDFPVTSCAYQTQFIGTEDQFIAAFTPSGNLICSGYMGAGNASSPNNETSLGGGSIAVDGNFVYLAAYTHGNYPVTPGCYQSTCRGSSDAAIAKLCIPSCGLTNINADFTADQTVHCDKGDSTNFTLQNISCDIANTTYLWAFPGGSPSSSTDQNPINIAYNTPGIFPVKVVIETPCKKDSITKDSYINVANNKPIAAFTANPQPASMSAPTVNFTDQSTNATQWKWVFNSDNHSSQQNPSHIYSDSGSYVVKLIVYNEYGCTDTIEQIIIINDAEYTFYIPNSFTPNGDGINDIFIPKNSGIDQGTDLYQLMIFDRWGQLIFSTNSLTTGWNGTMKGTTPVQIDTYVWKIKVKDVFSEEHQYTGHVNLLR